MRGKGKVRSVSWRLLLCMALAAILMCGAGTARADDENSIIIANGEWTPFISQRAEHHGIVSRIITEAFASEGVRVQYIWVPWKRALEETRAGSYDATSAWIPTPGRLQDFLFSDVIFTTRKVFFHLKSFNFDWRSAKDLVGLQIGGVRGYTYGPLFDAAVESGDITVQWVTEERPNFDKLLRGRIQLYPQELEVGYGYIRDMTPKDQERLTHHPKPLLATTHHLIFSRKVEKNRRLLEKFNRGLWRLKDAGILDTYLDEVRGR